MVGCELISRSSMPNVDSQCKEETNYDRRQTHRRQSCGKARRLWL